MICHSNTNVEVDEIRRDRRPTKQRKRDLAGAAGCEFDTGGGPARCGIWLNSKSNLVQADFLA